MILLTLKFYLQYQILKNNASKSAKYIMQNDVLLNLSCRSFSISSRNSNQYNES